MTTNRMADAARFGTDPRQRTRHELAEAPAYTPNEGFSIDAAMAGLAPGHWPDTLVYEGVDFHLVTKHWNKAGDLTHVTYHSGVATLTVEND